MKARKYVTGGPVDPKRKSKAVAGSSAKSRAQEVEESKMVAKRESEDRAIAEDIRKDIRSEVGPSMQNKRPSSNTGNVTLAMAKAQKITKDGVNYGPFKAGKFSRGTLAEQFGGQKQQPIYRKGQTLGYAPEREISSGAGFTAKASMPSRGVQKSGVPTPAAKTSKPAISAETQRKIEAGKDRGDILGKENFEATMADARRRGIRLNNGGMIPKKKK